MNSKLLLFGLIGILILNTGFSVLTENIFLYYNLDETTGSTIYDSLNNYNGNHSTLVKINQEGKINASAYYNATLYGTYSNTTKIGYNNFTFNAWIKINGTGTEGLYVIYSQREFGDGNPVCELFLNGTTYFNINNHLRDNSGSNYLRTNSGYRLYNNTWYMITWTFDTEGNTNMYINGILNSTGKYLGGSGASFGDVNSATIGANAYNYGNNFKGSIDEIGIWNTVKTQEDITKLYNEGAGTTYPFTTTNFNAITILDNTTWLINDELVLFNTPTNFLFTAYNSSGDSVYNLLTYEIYETGQTSIISTANITAGINASITFNNAQVSNYTILIYNTYNTSVNYSKNIRIIELNNITDQSINHFIKYNNSLTFKFNATYETGTTATDIYNLSIPELGLTLQNLNFGQNYTVTLNNSAVYNYTFITTHTRFGNTINKTYNFYTNAYFLSDAIYNSTISNNSYININWFLQTFHHYSSSEQIINVSINFNNSINYLINDDLNYSFTRLLKINNLFETIPFNIILNLSLNNEYLIFNNSYNFTITLVQLDDCSVYTTRILNISIRNEENINQLVQNSTLITYFYINNAIIPLSIYNDSDGIIGICINNSVPFSYDADFIFSAQNYGATDKISREHFFINASYNGSTQQQSFYKLSQDLATKKTFTLYDYNNRLLEGYIIRINRWYGDSFKTVAEAKTNNNGLALTYARFYDFAYYQIDVLNPSGSIVYSTDVNIFSSENNNIYLTAGSVSTYYSLLNEYEFYYYWNNNTQLFGSTISKLDGSDDTYYLRVYNMNGSIVCYKSNITSSWTSYCNLSNYKGTLAAQAFSINSDGRIVLFYTYYFENIDNNDYDWGSFGVILTFIIVLIMGFIGISFYYPIAPLMASIGLLLSILLNFINISFTAVIGLIFGSIILLLFMMKRSV